MFSLAQRSIRVAPFARHVECTPAHLSLQYFRLISGKDGLACSSAVAPLAANAVRAAKPVAWPADMRGNRSAGPAIADVEGIPGSSRAGGNNARKNSGVITLATS